MGDKVYLSRAGDEANLIEVDGDGIKVSFAGERRWFNKGEIVRIQLKEIRELSALAAGILLGILGFLMAGESLLLGALTVAGGGLAFQVGMGWRHQLVIRLDSSMAYSLTFFCRGVQDIQTALAKHGYLEKGYLRWLFGPR